ncbi:universal stress protein [Nodosilinea sp. LEGE 06152]|uniref:universal stress protein n=1 Tax=Nodosilinea sp. LEGE 06152 TaxID=2777966 RepID=UPI001880F25D|nr:universal stress protein [Nodosilinea sp. LEGE 06152]MBE9155598.1 universal stress protein [Nodosilinea sp. LEGE 06152]
MAQRILLCTDGSPFAQSSYPYGAWLAKRLGASVDVLYVSDDRGRITAEASNLSGSIGLGASESLLKKLVEVEHERAKLHHQQAKLILAAAEQILTTAGVESVKLIHRTGFLVDYLEKLEVDADLIVMGKRGESAQFAAGHLGANLERIVRASQRPCLITPRHYQPIERVLIAYDGSLSSQAMLTFVAQSPLVKGLEIHVITVAKGADDAAAVASLERAKHQLQATGWAPVCTLAEGDPEAAIAQYCQTNAVTLLLLGAYGYSRMRHLVIGSTTAQVLRSTDLPVLVFR